MCATIASYDGRPSSREKDLVDLVWAKGLYPLEAAVELLVRTANGRFARPIVRQP